MTVQETITRRGAKIRSLGGQSFVVLPGSSRVQCIVLVSSVFACYFDGLNLFDSFDRFSLL